MGRDWGRGLEWGGGRVAGGGVDAGSGADGGAPTTGGVGGGGGVHRRGTESVGSRAEGACTRDRPSVRKHRGRHGRATRGTRLPVCRRGGASPAGSASPQLDPLRGVPDLWVTPLDCSRYSTRLGSLRGAPRVLGRGHLAARLDAEQPHRSSTPARNAADQDWIGPGVSGEGGTERSRARSTCPSRRLSRAPPPPPGRASEGHSPAVSCAGVRQLSRIWACHDQHPKGCLSLSDKTAPDRPLYVLRLRITTVFRAIRAARLSDL